MCQVEREHYTAFLSSVYGGLEAQRKIIHDLDPDRPVWVVDVCRKEFSHIRHDSPIEQRRSLNRACLGGVRKSDVLIWLVEPRDGRTKFADDNSRVSLMEAEILQAVLQMMPIHLVQIEPTERNQPCDASVAGLLDLLRTAYPFTASDVTCKREAITTHVRAILRRVSPRRSLSRRVLTFRRYARMLSLKGASYFVNLPSIDQARLPLDHVEALLEDASDLSRDYSYRLSLLWVVLRNLQSWVSEESDPQSTAAKLMITALKKWESAAAWYGLHRHLGWGRFEVTNTLRTHGVVSPSADASLHYSLASSGPLCGRAASQRRVDAAIRAAKVKETGDPTGLMLIQAHHDAKPRFVLKPRLKVRWNPRRALRYAWRAVVIRQRQGETAHRLGEAQVDFGWMLCLNGNCRKGLSVALAGFSMLQQGGAEPGFLVQKRRVVGLCYFAFGDLQNAMDEWAMAYREALRHCAFDQIRWYVLLARHLVNADSTC